MEENLVKTTVIFVVFQTGTRANGGVESITQVIERLENIQPIVITQIETDVNQRWREAGAEVQVWEIPYQIGNSFFETSIGEKSSRLQSILETNYKMFQLVRQKKCKIVHMNDYGAWRHTGFGAKLAKAKVVLNIRDINPKYQDYGLMWQTALKSTDCQLVLSQEMRTDFAERLKIPLKLQEKIYYIYSIVDSEKMYPIGKEEQKKLRNRFQVLADTFTIGYVASFCEKKAQLNFILQAATLLKNSLPKARVYFLGDFLPEKDDYALQCLQTAEKLNLKDSLNFVGYTADIASWYKAVDLVIVPTRNEGLARCMIESLACGTPVISFDVCSAKEILEGYNCGLVVNQGDYVSLVEKIVSVAENPVLSQTLKENAAMTAKLFTPASIVQQYEQLYLSLR